MEDKPNTARRGRQITDEEAQKVATLSRSLASCAKGAVLLPGPPEELWELCDFLPRLPGPWQKKWAARWPGQVRQVSVDLFAKALALLDANHNSVHESVRVIDRVLSGNEPAPSSLYVGLAGPTVSKEVAIAEGVKILSGDRFPGPNRWPWNSTPELLPPQRPTCCIKVALPAEAPFATADKMQDEKWCHPDRPHFTTSLELGWQIAAFVGLLMFPAPVRNLGTRFSFDHHLLNVLTGCESSSWSPLGPQASLTAEPRPLEESVAAKWAALQNLGDHREAVLLACDRIGRYVQELRPQDRCVEACIAIEALFADGGADAATYKVVRRCARFLRQGVADRAELGKHLNRAMVLRGQIVHGVPFNRALKEREKKEREKQIDGVNEMAKAVVESVRKLLTLPRYPSADDLDYGPCEEGESAPGGA